MFHKSPDLESVLPYRHCSCTFFGLPIHHAHSRSFCILRWSFVLAFKVTCTIHRVLLHLICLLASTRAFQIEVEEGYKRQSEIYDQAQA